MRQRIDNLEREFENYRLKYQSTFALHADYDRRLEGIESKLTTIKADAAKPPRLGVVGTVSSGKTQTVETLLGDVGGVLNQQINAAATTGNIVEYAVSVRADAPKDDLAATYSNWLVSLLSEDEIKQIYFEVAEFLADALRVCCYNWLPPLFNRREYGIMRV